MSIKYTDDERKHLDFVQIIIYRMSRCSFQVKQWGVFFGLGLIIFDSGFSLYNTIPIILFWFLDAYYFNIERKYRGLFNDLTSADGTQKSDYDLNASEYLAGTFEYIGALFSRTISPVYISLLLLVICRGAA